MEKRVRKQAKPFKVEHKSRKPPRPAALFDEHDMMSGDERPPRDVFDDLSMQHGGSYEEALRAADAVFGGVRVAEATSQPSVEPAELQKRILTDLTYVDPLEARLAVPPPARGRKPGSKNKLTVAPPAGAPARLLVEAQAPSKAAVANFVRARSIGERRKRIGYIKQQQARRTMKPGDRWQLKLPRR